MADKTEEKSDKIKTLIRENTDRVVYIQERVVDIQDRMDRLKWLGKNTKTTDEEDKEDEEDEENEEPSCGMDCHCLKCGGEKVEKLNREARRVKRIRTEDDTNNNDTDTDNNNSEEDTDSELNNSDLAGEGFTTDDSE